MSTPFPIRRLAPAEMRQAASDLAAALAATVVLFKAPRP